VCTCSLGRHVRPCPHVLCVARVRLVCLPLRCDGPCARPFESYYTLNSASDDPFNSPGGRHRKWQRTSRSGRALSDQSSRNRCPCATLPNVPSLRTRCHTREMSTYRKVLASWIHCMGPYDSGDSAGTPEKQVDRASHTVPHDLPSRAHRARRQHRPTSGKHEMKKATTPTIATVIDSVSNVHFRTVFVSSGTCAGVSHYAAPDRDAHVIPHHPCTGMRGYRVYVYNYTICMCL